MKLGEKILKNKNDIESLTKRVELLKTENRLLSEMTELLLTDLITKQPHEKDILKITKSKKSYENILGGDGRSSPWSEQKIGRVVEIRLIKPNIYLSEETKAAYISYYKMAEEEKIDHIQWI